MNFGGSVRLRPSTSRVVRLAREVADGVNAPIRNPHVGNARRRTGAVDDGCTPNQRRLRGNVRWAETHYCDEPQRSTRMTTDVH